MITALRPLEAEPSTLEEAIAAWAAAEMKTRGHFGRKSLIDAVPAHSVFYKATVTEEHFRNSLLTMNPGPPADTLEICARRTLSHPQSDPEWQKALRHICTFAFADVDLSCLLFGHDLCGPFTIIDGTHRLFSAYAAVAVLKRIAFEPFRAFVAISDCRWSAVHFPDR